MLVALKPSVKSSTSVLRIKKMQAQITRKKREVKKLVEFFVFLQPRRIGKNANNFLWLRFWVASQYQA